MMADENKREASAEETCAAEEIRSAEHTQSTAEEPQADYLEKARELADSYSFLIRHKEELEREIEESRSWFYTREDVIYMWWRVCSRKRKSAPMPPLWS